MKIPDISHYHPVDSWEKAKESCSFLISKATQGTGFIDSTLDSFIKGCEKHGIPYWLYTFLNKGNEKAQAEYMVKVCEKKVGPHFVGYILDVEQKNDTGEVKEALDYIKKKSEKVMLYTMYADYEKYKNVIAGRGKNCAWWEARYGTNNGSYSGIYPPHSGADLHQYTSTGSCPGIAGRADLNRLTGTKDLSWFTGKEKPAKEKPAKKKPAIKEVAADVLAGKYGSGTARIAKLKKLGFSIAEIRQIQDKVNELLLPKSKYYARYEGKSKSIDTVFEKIGVPAKYRGSWKKRLPVAKANGITRYEGKDFQNIQLMELAKYGKLKKV